MGYADSLTETSVLSTEPLAQSSLRTSNVSEPLSMPKLDDNYGDPIEEGVPNSPRAQGIYVSRREEGMFLN